MLTQTSVKLTTKELDKHNMRCVNRHYTRAMCKYMLRGNTSQMPLITLTQTYCGGLTKSTANLHILCNNLEPHSHFSLPLSMFSFQSCFPFSLSIHQLLKVSQGLEAFNNHLNSLSLSYTHTHITSQHKHCVQMKSGGKHMTSTSTSKQ